MAGSAVLAQWLSRGDRQPDLQPGRTAAVRSCFEFLGSSLPSAALTRSLDGDDAAQALWLRADPCHVMVDAVAVRMLAIGTLELSAQESTEFARALRPLFGDAGFPLEPANPLRWYLRCAPETRLPHFADPEQVLGDDLLHHLPSGDNERQWRHLLNEAQVILHNHPLNELRVQRGLPAANSVWFWGAGKLPSWVRTPFAQVISNDPVVAGLARCAGTTAAAAASTSDIVHNAAKNTLLDLAHARGTLADDWLAPLDAALKHGTFAALTLRLESGQVVICKRWHRWRFWRRVRTDQT